MKNNISEFYNKYQYENNILTIVCYIADICNYNCKYCCNNFPRKNEYIDIDKLIVYLKLYYIKFNRNINIILLGGEPTLHPRISELCDKLSELDFIHFTLVSNFSADINLYIKILSDNQNLILSWHSLNKEFIDKLDKILRNNYKLQIFIALMLEKNAFDDMKYIANYLEHKNIEFNTIYICKPYGSNNNDLYEYSTLLLDYFDLINSKLTKNKQNKIFVIKKNGTSFIKLNEFFSPKDTINNFKMYKCFAGVDEIYIHSDGKIYPCEDCYRQLHKSIGIIDSFNPDIFKPQCCRFNICSCPYYSKKVKIINI